MKAEDGKGQTVFVEDRSCASLSREVELRESLLREQAGKAKSGPTIESRVTAQETAMKTQETLLLAQQSQLDSISSSLQYLVNGAKAPDILSKKLLDVPSDNPPLSLFGRLASLPKPDLSPFLASWSRGKTTSYPNRKKFSSPPLSRG